jgi:hypothetical protein
VAYLRFTPDEYRTLRDLHRRHGLDGRNLPSFKRLLVEALRGVSGHLARRITSLRGRRLELLYFHFRTRPPTVVRHDLNAEELRLVEEACVSAPFPVRFVKPFKGLLAEMLERSRPELAEKIARMSGYQFERLYNRAVGREWWGA